MVSGETVPQWATVKVSTGETQEYVLIAMDSRSEWLVGLSDNDGEVVVEDLIRKENTITIKPEEMGATGGVRYMWADEALRDLDEEEYTVEANSTLNWLKEV